MSTDATSPVTAENLAAPLSLTFGPQGRLLTAADLAALPTELPSGPVDYELNNGRLVIMSPPGRRHGTSQLRIGAKLIAHGEEKGYGEAMSDVGVVLWRNPDRVVSPDLLFIAKDRLPAKDSKEGYIETIPDLVVEVRSKNDSLADVEQKTQDYLKAGVRIVWVVDNDARTITISRADGQTQVLGENDTLRAEGVIPEFAAAVAGLFAS